MAKKTLSIETTEISNISRAGRTAELLANGVSIGAGGSVGMTVSKFVAARLAASVAIQTAATAAATTAAATAVEAGAVVAGAEVVAAFAVPAAVSAAAPVVIGIAAGVVVAYGVRWGFDKIFGKTEVTDFAEMTRKFKDLQDEADTAAEAAASVAAGVTPKVVTPVKAG